MSNVQPTKIYRGSVEEVFRHRGEIPANSFLELKVFTPAPEKDNSPTVEPQASLYDRYRHLFGTEHGLPSDLAEHAEEYLQSSGFGETRELRKL